MVEKMVKKVLYIIAVLLIASSVLAAGLSWTPAERNICLPSQVCGFAVITWEKSQYQLTCPQDGLLLMPGWVPDACVPELKKIAVRTNIFPVSYDTTEVKLTKENFPLLDYDTTYVAVVIAYEFELGRDNPSIYSNRIIFSTPKQIKKPFGIKIK